MEVVRLGIRVYFESWSLSVVFWVCYESHGAREESKHFWGFRSRNWEAGRTAYCNGDMGEGADL